jgi:putative transcriptional regulator
MRHFDERCLVPVQDLTPADILAIREQECVSQAVLARHLNVTTGLVSQWERGERHTSGPALTLLSLIKRKGLGVLTN